MKKWNCEKHEYEEYEIPSDWNTPLFTDNLDEIINCAQCGRKLKLGNSYTSLEVHNLIGFGYPVCEKCYKEELERKKKYEKI